MNPTYQWAKTVRYTADPQLVGEELERIRKRDDGLTVDAMLEEARPEDAPLHPLLTWDDQVAGENWRKAECRKIVRSVQVVAQERPERALYHVKVEKAASAPGKYQSASALAQNLDEYELAFKAACSRVANAQYALEELQRAVRRDDSEDAREKRAFIDQVVQALAIAKDLLVKAG